MFADRIKNLTASGIRKVFDLAAKMKNPVNFSIGQPDFDVPEEMKQAAIQAIQTGGNRYTVTQGLEELRIRIKAELQKSRQFNPESVLVTSGTSGGLLLLMLVLINPGDEVLLPDPYFVMYRHLLNLVGGIARYYNLYPNFQLNPLDIKKLITEKTKLIIINSPSNPTGAVFPEASLRQVAEIAREHNLLVLSDEIYDAFVYDSPHCSIATYYPNKTILLAGYSKSYGIPGWRMGYAAGPGDIIEKMTTLQQFSFVCAPAPAQYGCIKAFDIDMRPQMELYKQKRDLIYQGLVERGFQVTKPSGSFYIFPAAPGGDDQSFCEKAVEHEVLIIPGNTFSSSKTHFRISFAVANDVIVRGLDILAKVAKLM